MRSRVIRPTPASTAHQLTLSFEPGLTERYSSLRECIATGIYQRGLTNVAPSLDKAPGNLSVELSEDPSRKFGVESLELYIEKFGDLTPVYYLVEKFLNKQEAGHDAALAQIAPLLAQLAPLLRKSGLA
jgi:hypothetical protein